MGPRFAILVLVTISVALLAPSDDFADVGDVVQFRALIGGRLIDGSGADPVDDAAVVIRGRRILYAGPRTAAELPITLAKGIAGPRYRFGGTYGSGVPSGIGGS